MLAIDACQCMERCHLEHLQNLLHLRYLQLHGGRDDVELPEEIGTLKSLQTLDLKGFSLRKVVTTSMGLPTQLLCLRLGDPVFLEPGGIVGKLASLEELHLHYINCHGAYVGAVKELVKGIQGIRKLSSMPGIAGNVAQMVIVSSMYKTAANALRAVQSNVEWEAADLVLSRHLQRLFLNWTSFSRFNIVPEAEALLHVVFGGPVQGRLRRRFTTDGVHGSRKEGHRRSSRLRGADPDAKF